MTVIVCVEDSLGMLFNNRRVSRDVVVTNKIKELCGGKLKICDFSKVLFEDAFTDNNFLENATDDDFCFVENRPLLPYFDKTEKLIIFKWNRRYPSDFSLDLDLSRFKLVETDEFAGNSHEKITMEVYEK